ncbi:hypothetical protein CVS40_4751 [Lucilia cuprina]|nr:hypothetical protein CVS40_4751 [Lucilia cuprina]
MSGSHALKTASSGLEKRREFLLQLGLARHEAYELAKNSNFDVNDYQGNGVQLIEVNNRILSEIRSGKSWIEPVSHKDTSYFEKQDDDRVYKQHYRSRSRSPPSYKVQRNDHREERYQQSRSRSPNRNVNAMYGRMTEQRFLSEDEVRRREIVNESPPRSNRREEYKRRSEEYFSQDNFRMRHRSRSYSPLINDDHGIEEHHLSRSRSSIRNYDERSSNEYQIRREHIIDLTKDRMRKLSRSPLRCDSREERYLTSRSHYPNRDFDSMQERESENIFSDRNNFRNDVRRVAIREHSRSYSPSEYDRKEHNFHLSRSRSPARDYDNRNAKRSRSRPRPYSPICNDRNQEFYYSSKSRSPNRRINQDFYSQDNNFKEGLRRDAKHLDNLRETKDSKRPQREIPSLLTLDVFGNQTSGSQNRSQNHNIPSLLSLPIPDLIDLQQPSTSAKANHIKQKSKFDNREKPQPMKNKPTAYVQTTGQNLGLKQHIAEVPIIESGLKKPSPGKLKFNPQDYWSQWWQSYKYIEYSIPKINPNDSEVKECLKFLFKPPTNKFRHSKNSLLNKGVRTIMKTVDINETNYYVRDIYKLFKFKKHLEDPNFQNYLTPQELNCIAPALRQFQIKSTMAYLYQALICRWHISLDIMKKVQAGEPILSNYARNLLNDKCFNYLVMEAIRELKKMCQQDWPQFGEFYKNIKAKKINIYSMGLGPGMGVNNANPINKYNNEDGELNIY